MIFFNTLVFAVLFSFIHHVVGIGRLNVGENEIKRVQSAFKSAIAVPADVEAASASNVRTEATAYNLIQFRIYQDSSCSISGTTAPYLFISPNQCVPNTGAWYGPSSYKLTIVDSIVTQIHYTDTACQVPASTAATVTYTTLNGTSGCVPITLPSISPITTYVRLNLLIVSPGDIPMGSEYGMYFALATSQTACNALNASSLLANVVAAQPFSIFGSGGDSPFGIPFNQGLALTCSNDGLSFVYNLWSTKMKQGNLSLAWYATGGWPAFTATGTLPDCESWGPGSAYYYKFICV